VHTDGGNTCVGSKINGQLKPIITPLANGDEVEILRSPTQTPSPAWQSIAVTGKARAAIRRATRAATRRQYATLGEHMLETAVERRGRTYARQDVARQLPIMGQASLDDLLAAVGEGKIDAAAVAKTLHPDSGAGAGAGDAALVNGVAAIAEPALQKARAIPVRGLSQEMPVRFASECGAVPGDRIVGILTPGSGVTIYPIQSPLLAAFDDEPNRWLDVRWDVEPGSEARFPAMILVTTVNAPGSLAQIAQTIAEADGNIDNLRFTERGSDFFTMHIVLEVRDLKHLNLILQALNGLNIISEATRIDG
jgi:(p)ppGpp synthase/HD superfamily hydrolase